MGVGVDPARDSPNGPSDEGDEGPVAGGSHQSGDVPTRPAQDESGAQLVTETEVGLPSLVGTAATGARHSRTSTHAVTRVHGTSGRWLRVTAVPMEGGDGHVGVMLEPARPADLALRAVRGGGRRRRPRRVGG